MPSTCPPLAQLAMKSESARIFTPSPILDQGPPKNPTDQVLSDHVDMPCDSFTLSIFYFFRNHDINSLQEAARSGKVPLFPKKTLLKKMKMTPPNLTSRSVRCVSSILTASGFMLGATSSHAAVVASWESDVVKTSDQGSPPLYMLPATFKEIGVSGAALTISPSATPRTTADGYGFTNTLANRAGNEGQALAKGTFFEFSLTTLTKFTLDLTQISLNLQRDLIGGPTQAKLYSDIGGFVAGHAIASASGGSGDLFPAPIPLGAAFQNLSQVTFRVYAWDVSNANPKGAFLAGPDSDILIEGTLTAIPEISTSLPLGGLLGFSILGFRRRKK